MAQFAIDHGEQSRGQQAFAQFAQTKESIFRALLTEVESLLGPHYGSYKTAFMQVHQRISEDHAKSNQLIQEMSDKMGLVNKQYISADDDSQQLLATAGSSGQGQFNGLTGIFNG